MLILAKFLSYLGFSVLLTRVVSRWVHGPAWSRLGLPWPALGLALLLLGAGLEVGVTLHSLGFGLADAGDYLTSTRQGKAAITRVLGAVLVLAAEATPALWWLNPVGALLVALGLGSAGHAAEQGSFWAVLDSLHALAAALWLGGLLALRTQRPTAHEAQNFSRLAAVCVAVPLLSGLAAALSHLPAGVAGWQALTGSGWGLLLLGKLGVIVLALLSALVVRSRLLAAGGKVAQRTRRRQEEPPQPALWLAAETTLLLVVLGLSGALSSSAPPALVTSQAQQYPLNTALDGQTLTGKLDISARGEVQLQFSGAGPVATKPPQARLLMTDHPMPPQALPLRCDDTHCEGHAQLWMSGNWVLELRQAGQVAKVPFRY